MRAYCLKQLLLLFLFAGVSTVYAQTIATGHDYSFAVCSDGTVRSWGANYWGQLGDSTYSNKTTPVQVNDLSGISAIDGGEVHSLFLKNDGSVWACGNNDYGQLGDGTYTSKTTPVQVSGLTGIIAIAAGISYSLFLKNDSTVWACGNNDYGQLGDGTVTSRIIPIQVNSLTGIKSIAAGGAHSLFLKSDGTVWACGYNINGPLGDGTTNNKYTPVQVNGLMNIMAITGGGGHSLFLKNDGTVLACGSNNFGQLGDGTTTHQYTPVPVNGLTGITAMAARNHHSLFLKNDGSVLACGYNNTGQLGDGTTITRLTPVQVSGLMDITAIECGRVHSLFLKKNGTILTCGYNYYGQLGDGTFIDKHTPVQAIGLCLVRLPKGVYGSTFLDINQNCNRDAGETGLIGRRAVLNPGNIMVQTDAVGIWYLDSLPTGNYTITADTSGKWKSTCPASQNFTVTDPGVLTYAPWFGFVSTAPCASPEVTVHAPFLRRCFSNQKIYVQACNQNIATGTLSNSFIDIELDPFLIPQSASMVYTSLGNNIYRFNTGTLNPGACINFNISCSLSCDAMLNQTLCMEANLYPADSCVFDTVAENFPVGVTPCTLPWDRSSLKVEGACINDSIRFVVYNTGEAGGGDMDCYSPIRVYVDGVLIKLDSIRLAGGDSVIFIFSGDGRTWRLEADQHPQHPGNSKPNATIEACGNKSNWRPDLVNVLPQDDADPVVDIYCGLVTGSYDPNDKTGYPIGITDSNFIVPNQSLQYLIRFQNTGTDTAFTVIVRDTLEADLDIFSVVSGVSSHNYTFKMHGPRVLEWTFNNILLPDSNTNQAASNGFITFTVKQNKTLPNGTLINNSADIYFDFNAPIITNRTQHTVNNMLQVPQLALQTSLTDSACQSYTLNGFTYNASGTYYQSLKNIAGQDSIIILNLIINVNSTVSQNQNTLTSAATGSNYQWIDCNNDSLIAGETNQSYTATGNGSYAVIVNKNGCLDTSACYTITGIGVMKNGFGAGLTVFPNPTNGRLSIDLNDNYKDIIIEVISITGQLLLKEKFSSKQLIDLNLEHLANGVYMVKIAAGDKKATIRVVKGE